jgi:hypothetical protein
MPYHLRLLLETMEATTPLIGLLRRHTGKPISELRTAITTRQPFLDEPPHHNQYSEFIARVTRLLDDLEGKGIRYLVEVDGSPESSLYLRNVFRQWHDIRAEVSRMTDLESGAPCIETLEWMKRASTADVFRQTLRQIVDGDCYTCDEQTVAWARRELDTAAGGTP